MALPLKLLFMGATVLALGVALCAQGAKPGKNQVTIRGQSQKVYFYPRTSETTHAPVLFAPGDRGCEGFAVTIAQRLSQAGYDTYCLDTRHYLESFTSDGGLTTTEIASDFNQLAKRIEPNREARVLLIGWSEGAGLELAAAADKANQALFLGLIAIGIPETNILAWHWKDIAASLTKTVPNEPTFKSSELIGLVSPLPLFVIASTSNDYVSPEATRALYGLARQPKQLVVVNARDHKYSGNTDGFFRALEEGLNWIIQNRP
jgi:pimeloyl-ACP methyl ester carboxylesterase